MSTHAAAPLAPDLEQGLKRLKLRRMRQLAPELLQTAKTQRWLPEELLRTLVEAEIAARDEANLRPTSVSKVGVVSRSVGSAGDGPLDRAVRWLGCLPLSVCGLWRRR